MINIFYSADNVMFTQLVMSIISLTHTTKEPLKIVVLTTEVPEFDPRGKKLSEEQVKYCNDILKQANKKSSLISIDVSNLFKEYLLDSVNVNNRFYSYYVTVRLLADLVPEIGDKAIYLDTDVLATKDIKELWDIDVSNTEVAGRRDAYRITRYIQSGIMLLNMAKIRESGTFRKACKLCKEKKFFAYIDMTAINVSTTSKKIIDKKYVDYKVNKKTVLFHVCTVRLGKFPLIGKWWYRIKPDEFDLFEKAYPRFAWLIDDTRERIKRNPELFLKRVKEKA